MENLSKTIKFLQEGIFGATLSQRSQGIICAGAELSDGTYSQIVNSNYTIQIKLRLGGAGDGQVREAIELASQLERRRVERLYRNIFPWLAREFEEEEMTI